MESNNSKQQGLASDTTPKTGAATNKNKQTNTTISNTMRSLGGGRQCHSCEMTFMQGSSKPFGSCPAPPKQPPLPSAIFTPEKGGNRQQKVRQQYQQ
eukprot:5312252-Ditylum_brightwellii.AAC.1